MGKQDTYSLLDSGLGRKLERYGAYTLARPASQAIWMPALPDSHWDRADGIFTREEKFQWLKSIDEEWTVEILGLKFLLSTTAFGHLGVFPEQKDQWQWIENRVQNSVGETKKTFKVLNLFAYSGGATLIAARAGADVCHLDASKGMVAWARENAIRNSLENRPIRWIVEDVKKFLSRELRRGNSYDGIILDPPTFGKGGKGELFKFEEDLYPILTQCQELLSKEADFLLLSCHTPNITPTGLLNALSQTMKGHPGHIEHGEMLLKGQEDVLPLPNGTYARWSRG